MKVKNVLLLAAAAALVYTLIVHPAQLGDGVQAILNWFASGISAVVTFLRSIVT